MHESWHRYLRLGIVHFMAFPETLRGEGPIVETLKQIGGDEFFTAIELGWVNDAKAEPHQLVGQYWGRKPRLSKSPKASTWTNLLHCGMSRPTSVKTGPVMCAWTASIDSNAS